MNQQDIPLFQCDRNDANVRALVEFLLSCNDWQPAAHVLAHLSLPNTETNRRKVRAWAEATDGEIISGQAGYRHVKKATTEEISHSSNWLLSQGKKMIKRALRIRRWAHTIIR